MVSLPRPALIASSSGDAVKLSSPDVPNRTGIVPSANCSASKELSASVPSGLPARRSTTRMSVPGRKMMPNSMALPEGSVKNIAACSPTVPAKRSCGSMMNWVPAATKRSRIFSQSGIGSTSPKCRTGTSSPSTGLVMRLRASPGT